MAPKAAKTESKDKAIKYEKDVKQVTTGKIDELVEKAKMDAEVVELSNVIGESNLDEEVDSVERPKYEEEIVEIIRSNSSPRLMKQKLDDYHDNNIANALALLKVSERKKLYRVLDDETLSSIFEYVEEDAGTYVNEMDLKKASTLISHLEPDTAIEVLKSLDKNKRTLLIDSMESGARKDLKMVASFDEDEIGSEITTNCIIIKDDLSIKEAMKELVKQAKENDNIQTIFVEDETGAFLGAIDLKELIVARSKDNLKDLIVTSFPYVYGHENKSDVIDKLREYNETLVPVLDNNNTILGVITSQSMVDVVDSELSEDYVKFAGLTSEEDLKEPLLKSMSKRLPWLLVLLGLGLIVSTAVGAFERVISGLTIIITFQSLILDMAGNAGTQSLAVTIRVLMDENLTIQKKLGFVFKEVRVGFANGFLIGIVSFALIGVYLMIFKNKDLFFSFSVSSCIGISLLAAMIISSAMGTLIPMFFHRLKVDPAVASGPLITTINDLIAVLTYYSLCGMLLINVLHLDMYV